MFIHMFDPTSLLPHPSGNYLPTFAQVHHMCQKFNAVAFNPQHKWSFWPTTHNHLPPTLHTTLHTLDTLILSPNMSSEGWQTLAQLSTEWQELSSRNTHANGANNTKQKVGGAKTHNKKLCSQPYTSSLAYNMSTLLLFRPPPSATLSSHYVHRFGGAQCAKTKTPAATKCQRQRREAWTFFFPPTNRFCDLFRYNISVTLCECFLLVFFFSKLFQDIIYYNQPSFIFYFSFFPPPPVNFCGQRHLLFRLYASLYRVANFPSSFCTGFNIEQHVTNVYDAIRHYHCPLPVFTVRSVLFNKHTLHFAKKLMYSFNITCLSSIHLLF